METENIQMGKNGKRKTSDTLFCSFMWNDVIKPALLYVLALFIISIPFVIKKSPAKIIEQVLYKKSGIVLNISNFNQIMVNVIWIILVLAGFFCFLKHVNKNNDFHKNGNGYLDCPYWVLNTVAKPLGYVSINTVNVALWLQFKIYRSSSWETKSVNESNYPQSLDDVVISKYKAKKENRVVNLILEDTYPVYDKIPESILCSHDTVKIRRKSNKPGYRSINKDFLSKVSSEVYKIYKENYEQINLFLTTNPYHTKMIVRNSFRTGPREKDLRVVIYQSIGENHEYTEPHIVIM